LNGNLNKKNDGEEKGKTIELGGKSVQVGIKEDHRDDIGPHPKILDVRRGRKTIMNLRKGEN